MIPTDIELHDGRLREVTFNPMQQTVVLTVDAYQSPSSDERRRLQIVFEEVSNFRSSMDVVALADNFKAGNMNYWSPAVSLRDGLHNCRDARR